MFTTRHADRIDLRPLGIAAAAATFVLTSTIALAALNPFGFGSPGTQRPGHVQRERHRIGSAVGAAARAAVPLLHRLADAVGEPVGGPAPPAVPVRRLTQ